MDCGEASELFSALHDGEAGAAGEAGRDAARHVEACAPCREAYRAFAEDARALVAMARRVPPVRPEEWRARWERVAAAGPPVARPAAVVKLPFRRRLAWMALAAALVFGVYLAIPAGPRGPIEPATAGEDVRVEMVEAGGARQPSVFFPATAGEVTVIWIGDASGPADGGD